MTYLLLMFMSLLVSIEASVSMPTSMPSINHEVLSTKITIEQNAVEELGDMSSIALAPSMQPTNYEQTTLLSNPTIETATPTRLSSPFRSKHISSQKQWRRFNCLFPGSSSGYVHSSCLMSQTQTTHKHCLHTYDHLKRKKACI